MDETAPLMRLMAAAGIEANYWDIQGNLHETTPETARLLLRALGISADNDAEIAASLTMLAEEPWRETLPPVIVAREHCNIEIPFRQPVDAITKNVHWSIELESGEIRTGECSVDALPVEEIDGTGHIALRKLSLPALPPGYHHLRVAAVEQAAALLIVAPPRCWLPEDLRRRWGVAAQLYSLKSERDWGIGDFASLRTLIDRAAELGADMIGLNPLHALFPDAPENCSPYSPSSRLFLNPLYLDVTAIADFAESDEARGIAASFADALQNARAAELVDYRAVAAVKCAVLEALYRNFEDKYFGSECGRAFDEFVTLSGQDLHGFAIFQALSEHFGTHDWKRWPSECCNSNSRTVNGLTQRLAHRVRFFEYLQWQCHEQLSQAAELAREKMGIGLYADLAVSVDAASADHWANREIFAGEARVGAPPDPFNERGQEWGVVPFDPRALRRSGYAHFIALLRANMRHADALRIDHVMGWQRLFLIPAGAPAAQGAYVRFPFDDLLAIAALESHRNRCIVIGEDLGTVPAGFREHMADANIMSCRILYFEREHGRFRRPAEFPTLAAVSASTHDLATLRGFWTGTDIAAKARLGIFRSPDEENQGRAAREDDKRSLLQALAEEGLLPAESPPTEHWTPALGLAIHRYLARSSSLLLMVQLDDLANEPDQANLPGTTAEYPNWRRRLHRTLEELFSDADLRAAMSAIDSERL
jgi:4-alpha-glucanotransferase